MSDIIRTDRLVLRPPAHRDADAIVALAGDWDVARMTGRIPHPYARADAEHFVGLDIGARMAEFQGQVVGCFGVEAKADGAVELGYWIGKPYWGRGFATEGARGLIRHLRAQDPNSRITVSHMADNPASRRVIEKLGFQPSGEGAIWCVARGRTVRVLCYELPGVVPESD